MINVIDQVRSVTTSVLESWLWMDGWWQKVDVERQHFTQMSDNQRQWETEWIIWSQLDIDLKSNITLFWSNRCTQTLSLLFSYLSSASYLIYIVWCSLLENCLAGSKTPALASSLYGWMSVIMDRHFSNDAHVQMWTCKNLVEYKIQM